MPCWSPRTATRSSSCSSSCAACRARSSSHRSRRVDYAGCVQQQLDAGARPDHAAADADGVVRTPLAVAARLPLPAEVVRALVEAKAPLDAVDADGRCALMLAAAHGHPEALGVLLGVIVGVALGSQVGHAALSGVGSRVGMAELY